MALPEPVNGLVIRYAYLWHWEFARGAEEGTKDRPCAIILATQQTDGGKLVTVLPITHAPPSDSNSAIEIPAETKRRLGLDSRRSWVVLTELNRFVWPGPDLRFAESGDSTSVGYGILPSGFFRQLRDQFIVSLGAGKTKIVPRTN